MKTYIIGATSLVLALFVFYAIMTGLTTGETFGIVVGVLIAVGILIFLYWKRHYILKQCGFKTDEEKACLVVSPFSRKKVELLIKRCEQETTRDVEANIIQRSPIKEVPWRADIDNGQKPVLVFCVISSRIGTDIDSAMRGVNMSSSVILVLLHFMQKSLLTGDLSDDEYLLDQETKQRFEGIAHFAFSEREQLYNCRQNQAGFTKIDQLVSQVLEVKRQ